ncbi:hypothetical protein AXI59_04275 [Bacillus nakamurai]|nr:hypothetical protein AXI59_04275 [Bacillus nakamurai]
MENRNLFFKYEQYLFLYSALFGSKQTGIHRYRYDPFGISFFFWRFFMYPFFYPDGKKKRLLLSSLFAQLFT